MDELGDDWLEERGSLSDIGFNHDERVRSNVSWSSEGAEVPRKHSDSFRDLDQPVIGDGGAGEAAEGEEGGRGGLDHHGITMVPARISTPKFSTT